MIRKKKYIDEEEEKISFYNRKTCQKITTNDRYRYDCIFIRHLDSKCKISVYLALTTFPFKFMPLF